MEHQRLQDECGVNICWHPPPWRSAGPPRTISSRSPAGGGSSPGTHGLDAIVGYCSLSTENLGPGMNDHDGTGQDGRPGLNLMACRSSAPRSFQQFGPLDAEPGHHMLTFCPHLYSTRLPAGNGSAARLYWHTTVCRLTGCPGAALIAAGENI